MSIPMRSASAARSRLIARVERMATGADARLRISLLLCAAALASCATPSVTTPPARAELVAAVTAAETAFARTMADRDFAAFMRFVADDAIFLNGGRPLRGKAAVGGHWQRFFQSPSAPFSWRPEFVEVIESGALAQTTGPVMSPDGKIIARFYSTWRRSADGRWQVVFDDGYDVCN